MQGGTDVPAQARLRALVDATAWLETRDKSLFISLNYGWLADLCAALGRHADTRRYAGLAYTRARKDDRVGAAMACRALARAEAGLAASTAVSPLAGSPGLEPPRLVAPRAAAHRLMLADRIADLRRSPRERAVNRLCEADLALAAGDADRAAGALQLAGQAFADLQMPWHEAQATRRLAALNQPV
jgi:hypothetical protein